ncbi:unnamed protein product [marine sediment metagenome]|uniref:Response regulatory domain-containing protein n=1 Tax=marine sediment metagenome TaxID=412755 RepID=X1JJS9_9ZZZZ
MVKKVLIASESAFRRTFLSEMLGSHKDIIIVDFVRNANEAIDIIEKKSLDALILDIEFENEEWVKQFYPVMKSFPIKTIILTDKNLKTLDSSKIPIFLKSYDYIVKPNGVWKDELPKIRESVDKSGKIPDIIWDKGSIGKEPMIRLFAKNSVDMIQKLKKIVKLL